MNTIEPEPIAQIEAAHAIEQAAHALIEDSDDDPWTILNAPPETLL